MKTILKIFLISVAAALSAGCELERYPYDEISADQLDATNIENITLGNYAKLKEEYYFKTIHQFGEYGGDNVALSGTTSDNLFKHYTFRREKDNHYTARVWQFTYQMAVNINSTIEAVPEGESAEKDQLLGENYFLRGFLYFQLCNIFGRPYSHPDPAANLGIPLKLTSKIDDFPPRSTVAQVYEQVVKDFKKGEELMASQKINIFASKEVAQAFLSRVYLYMENWEEAAAYATKVIESGRYTLLQGSAYRSYTNPVPEANTETIFAIRMVKDVDFKNYHMDWYSTGALFATIDNIGWGEMYPSQTYLDLLDEHKSDLRHAFIVNDKENATLRLSYVLYTNNTYQNITDTLEALPQGYKILENPGAYKSDMVQTETAANGDTRYYVERNDGKKCYVRVENISLRNGFPKRFIYKTSMQEGQSHLYSPVLIRLGEVYLNRAEALAELGRDDEALADLNVIRARAEVPAVSDFTTKDLKAWIADERRLELAWEGFRKHDIFRRKQTMDRKYPGTHLSGEPVYLEVGWDAPYIVEFIPQSEVDAYPTPLTQNP
jgi:tetratricopeptide (TPR) repeat protein